MMGERMKYLKWLVAKSPISCDGCSTIIMRGGNYFRTADCRLLCAECVMEKKRGMHYDRRPEAQA